ncbi:hypothetical protein NL676_032579 [Syzygium grande]|nr:hypothetical protein NL676_032579 [Syzygium grande]
MITRVSRGPRTAGISGAVLHARIFSHAFTPRSRRGTRQKSLEIFRETEFHRFPLILYYTSRDPERTQQPPQNRDVPLYGLVALRSSAETHFSSSIRKLLAGGRGVDELTGPPPPPPPRRCLLHRRSS